MCSVRMERHTRISARIIRLRTQTRSDLDSKAIPCVCDKLYTNSSCLGVRNYDTESSDSYSAGSGGSSSGSGFDSISR